MKHASQSLIFYKFFPKLVTVVSLTVWSLVEFFPLWKLQGSAFLLSFYKLTLMKTLTSCEGLGLVLWGEILFIFFANQSWAHLTPLDNMASMAHTSVLVLTSQVLLIKTMTNTASANNNSSTLTSLLAYCICLGGVWVYYNGPSQTVWSWDPVEITSLFLFSSYAYLTHLWTTKYKLIFSLYATCLMSFFSFGPASSAHHLSNNKTTLQSVLPEISFYKNDDFTTLTNTLPPLNVFLPLTIICSMPLTLLFVKVFFMPKYALLTALATLWCFLLPTSFAFVVLNVVILSFFFTKPVQQKLSVLTSAHMLPLTMALFLHSANLLSPNHFWVNLTLM